MTIATALCAAVATAKPEPSHLPRKYFIKSVRDDAESRIQGRDVMVQAEWRKIRVDTSTVLVGPVTDADRQTLEYKAWKDGASAPGTPIARLIAEGAKDPEGTLDEDAAAEIEAHYGISTCEQLANYPDGKFIYNGGGRTLQRKARELLERLKVEAEEEVVVRREADHSSILTRLAQLEAENASLRKLREEGKK